LIGCTLVSGCFADGNETLSSGFIDCYLFSGLRSDPPCKAEFDAVLEGVNITEVGKCFLNNENDLDKLEGHMKEVMAPVPQMEPFHVHASLSTHRKLLLPPFPGDSPQNSIPESEKNNSLDLVSCLAGALLPPDAKDEIISIFNDLLGIAGFVFDVIDKGLYIPGELILFVFGWAEYNDGEGFSAPYKWYYCMFSVVIFLTAIEVFKLLALRHVVWTKR